MIVGAEAEVEVGKLKGVRFSSDIVKFLIAVVYVSGRGCGDT